MTHKMRHFVVVVFLMTVLLFSAGVCDPISEAYWKTFYIMPISSWGSTGSEVPDYLNRMLVNTGGVMPKNIKVGISLPSTAYLLFTQTGYYDYIYNPYHSLEMKTYLDLARTHNVQFGTHVNGVPWADGPYQGNDHLHNYLETYNGGENLQVDRYGRIRKSTLPQDPTIDEQGDPFAPHLEMQLTPSRYCSVVQDYTKQNVNISMRFFRWWMDQHPDLMVFASGSSEVRMNGDANHDYCDYSSWSKQEFRDWLSGAGVYAGQGQYSSLSQFNSTFGFSYATWDAVEPPTSGNWSDSWWNKWHEFRVHQIQAMVEQHSIWMNESGLCPDQVFSHQTNDDPTDTNWIIRELAAPYTTCFGEQSSNGITAYGPRCANTTLFNNVYANDKNWGLFEYNRGSNIVSDHLNALNATFDTHAHIICPYMWYGQEDYQIKDKDFETALAQFIANRSNQSYQGLKKHETAPRSRDLIWGMSESDDIENFSNITAPVFSNGVLSGIISDVNPSMGLELDESSHLLMTNEYHAISFRMYLENPGTFGYFFWHDGAQWQNITFETVAGWHIYRLNLAENPNWRNRGVGMLAFYPTTDGSGQFQLDWVRIHAQPCWNFDSAEEIHGTANFSSASVAGGMFDGTDTNGDGHFWLSTDKTDPNVDADRAFVDADEYTVFRTRLVASSTGTGQLYWLRRGESFASIKAHSFPVQAGDHTYEIDLSEVAGWDGQVTRLRFDPVNTMGVQVEVDFVSFSPRMLAPRAALGDLIVNSSLPVFRWEAPQELNHTGLVWDLQVATDFEFTNVVLNETGLNDVEYTCETGLGNGLHWWRVRTKDDGGAVSPWNVPMPMYLKRWEFDHPHSVLLTNDFGTATVTGGTWSAPTTGGDPYLLVNNGGRTNADTHSRMHIRMKVEGGSGTDNASVYIIPAAGGLDLVSFTVQLDGAFHDYYLDLSTSALWNGEISTLRLDPVTASGLTVTLDRMELLPPAAGPSTPPPYQYNVHSGGPGVPTWNGTYFDCNSMEACIQHANANPPSSGQHVFYLSDSLTHTPATAITGPVLINHWPGNGDVTVTGVVSAGAGGSVTVDGTMGGGGQIIFDGGTNQIDANSGTLVVGNCVLRNSPSNNARVRGSGSLTINNCEIHNAAGNGVANQGGTLVVNDCLIHTNAIGVRTTAAGTTTISNTNIHSNTSYGVECAGADTVLNVNTGSRVSQNTASGITIAQSATLTVEDSEIQDNGQHGVLWQTSGSSNTTNIFRRCTMRTGNDFSLFKKNDGCYLESCFVEDPIFTGKCGIAAFELGNGGTGAFPSGFVVRGTNPDGSVRVNLDPMIDGGSWLYARLQKGCFQMFQCQGTKCHANAVAMIDAHGAGPLTGDVVVNLVRCDFRNGAGMVWSNATGGDYHFDLLANNTSWSVDSNPAGQLWSLISTRGNHTQPSRIHLKHCTLRSTDQTNDVMRHLISGNLHLDSSSYARGDELYLGWSILDSAGVNLDGMPAGQAGTNLTPKVFNEYGATSPTYTDSPNNGYRSASETGVPTDGSSPTILPRNPNLGAGGALTATSWDAMMKATDSPNAVDINKAVRPNPSGTTPDIGAYENSYDDRTAPTGSVVINGGAAWTNNTNVTLTLSASDGGSGVWQMQIYDGNGFNGWENYATTRSAVLPSGNGTKEVAVQYMDNMRNTSSFYSDTIGLDQTAPTGSININNGEAITITRNVTLNISAADTGGSGVAQMRVGNTPGAGSWEAYSSGNKAWELSAGEGTKTVYITFRDTAGNLSNEYSNTIDYYTATPTGTNTPVPTETGTPEPTTTNTSEPTVTDTPDPLATDTTEPTLTNTPDPLATDTTVPTATDTTLPTETPTPTDTPDGPTATPTATWTPVAPSSDVRGWGLYR